MELLKAQKLCRELMDLHGLTLKNKWTFKWSNSKKTAGTCSYKGISRLFGGAYPEGGVITLSKLITPIHSDEKVRDTILHEIAHGLTKGHNHDYVWQRKALEIGSDGKRCFASCPELKEMHKETSKYTGTCPLCQHKFYKSRLPKGDRWHTNCARKPYTQENKVQYALSDNRYKAIEIPKTAPTQRVPIAASRSFQRYVTAANTSTNATMNREVRRLCNQYMGDTDRMTNKEFQDTWFYEGVMIGRTTWGKNAPWIGK